MYSLITEEQLTYLAGKVKKLKVLVAVLRFFSLRALGLSLFKKH